MNFLCAIFAILPLVASAEESFVFTWVQESPPTGQRIEGNNLHVVVPIQRIEPPKAISIRAFEQKDAPRRFKIEVVLNADPKAKHGIFRGGFEPMFKLGDDIVMRGINVSYPEGSRFPSLLTLVTSDPQKIRRWCRELGILLGVPEERIRIEIDAEQGGAGQPATASESKPEGGENPKPESDPAPR